ncbi:hypothetical protein L1049_002653 [Liquidambar formosana]|uniref:Uncharacterized protein n=1 Tax=Liquidambar formosana TaxID=63359 RepID=A0AAP0NFE2_LIQFO
MSLDKNGEESVSTLMNEEYAEEAEIASITDDDVSSHSSLTISSSAYESNGGLPGHDKENGSETVKDSTGGGVKEHAKPSKLGLEKSNMMPVIAPHENMNGSSSCSSSIDLSSGPGSPVNGHASLSNFSESRKMSIPEEIVAPSVQSSSSSIAYENADEESNSSMRSNGHDNFGEEVHEKVAYCKSDIKGDAEQIMKENISNGFSTKVTSPNADSQDR